MESPADRLRLAAAGAWNRRLARSALRAGVVLVYHRVGGGGGELEPALPVDLFERQLDLLRRRHEVVAAHALRDAVRGRRPGQRFPVALTFDDDLPSHAATAAPLLSRRGLPATFFLGGGAGGGWWRQLEGAVRAGSVAARDLPDLPPELVEAALARRPGALRRLATELERLPPDRRDAALAAVRASAAGEPPPLDHAEIRSLVDAGGTIGFHTRGHYDLRTLDDERLRRELTAGRERLARIAGRPVEHVAYPHGKADDRVAAAARAAGFRAGFTGSAAAVVPDADPLLLPRIEPSPRTPGHFALWIVRTIARSGAPARY